MHLHDLPHFGQKHRVQNETSTKPHPLHLWNISPCVSIATASKSQAKAKHPAAGSMETESLLQLLSTSATQLKTLYEEIGDPSSSYTNALQELHTTLTTSIQSHLSAAQARVQEIKEDCIAREQEITLLNIALDQRDTEGKQAEKARAGTVSHFLKTSRTFSLLTHFALIVSPPTSTSSPPTGAEPSARVRVPKFRGYSAPAADTHPERGPRGIRSAASSASTLCQPARRRMGKGHRSIAPLLPLRSAE